MSRQKLGLIAIGIAVAAAFGWAALTQGPLAPVKVTVQRVASEALSNAVFGIGTIEARRSYSLSPTMTSRVKAVRVDQGDVVKAGQLLAEMDPVDLDDKLAASEQAAARAENAVRIATAQVLEATSRADNAAASFRRYTELRARGFVSQELLDAKQRDKDAAQAGLDAANATLAAARNDQSKAHADANGVRSLRKQAHLLSPVDGVVTARLVEPGSTAVPGQAVLQVVDPASLWVKARIDQKQAGQIALGQPAEISLRSQPSQRVAGKVARVDLVSDAVTEERIVNVAFDPPSAQPGIGESCEVTIRLPELANVRSVPTAAVKHVQQRDGVWVLKDGSVQLKPVVAGIATLDGRTQIVQGLSDGDEVIVYSQQPLRDGMKVKVAAAIAPANP